MTSSIRACIAVLMCITGCNSQLTEASDTMYSDTTDAGILALYAPDSVVPTEDETPDRGSEALQAVSESVDASERLVMPEEDAEAVGSLSDASTVVEDSSALITADAESVLIPDAGFTVDAEIEDVSCFTEYGGNRLRLCGQDLAVECEPNLEEQGCLTDGLTPGTYIVHAAELVQIQPGVDTCTLVARNGYCHVYTGDEQINVPAYYRETVVNVIDVSGFEGCPVEC